MIYNYYKVDKHGFITERYRLDENDKLISLKDLKKEWNGELISPFYDNDKSIWKELESNKDIVSEYKSVIINELSKTCHNLIIAGFDVEIDSKMYHFSYDYEAQLNFQDTIRLFDNNILDSINWTASLQDRKVRIPLSREQFNYVYNEGIKHKVDIIANFKDELIPRIEKAESCKEIENIKLHESKSILKK